MTEYFILQEEEKMIKEIKPSSKLKWYFFFNTGQIGLISVIVPATFIFLIFSYAAASFLSPSFFFLGIILLIIGAIILNLILSLLQYDKQFYWITSKRIIYKRGIIGYQITSIPYERISDVIISRTFFEKLFGFGSLHVQSLAGQISGGSHLGGSEALLLAIPKPEETQELIFQLLKTKRVKERLTF